MRRALFSTAATVSLLLLGATLTFWVRSYPARQSPSQYDSISFTHQEPLYWIISYPGKAVLCRQTGKDWNFTALPDFHLLGVNFGGGRGRDGSMLWNLELPYWLLAVISGLLTGVWGMLWRRDVLRRRRARTGYCAGCGYDLRATPGRCPECGRETDVARTTTP